MGDIFKGGGVLAVVNHDQGDQEWQPGRAPYRGQSLHAPGYYAWKQRHGLRARLLAAQQAQKENGQDDDQCDD